MRGPEVASLVSLAMEGKFASDGLQAIGEGNDILMVMPRELVTEKGIGESADATWKTLVEKQAEVFGMWPTEACEQVVQAEPQVGDLPEVIVPLAAPILSVGSGDTTRDVRRGTRSEATL